MPEQDYDCEEGEIGIGRTLVTGTVVFDGCIAAPTECDAYLAGAVAGERLSACGEAICPDSEGWSMTSTDRRVESGMFLVTCN